ncbi:MAG: glycosyltransferase family 2 protein [Candidatus Hydrogenedentes bacterium]|nr:glycosyltransferase family 2 protein [Candidatus Hydrogenedentota bacterium]
MLDSCIIPEVGDAPSEIILSFVVIGYNEAALLDKCLQSIRVAELSGLVYELIYVDGGSEDQSREVAQVAGVDQSLGGEKRRRASENRNVGFAAACGRFIQFVDGDMTLYPDWPKTALGFLHDHPEIAAVCGNLIEANANPWFKALQIDWAPREGPIRHCGGAALYRREVLEKLGGFPEDLPYGEEPVFCWRIRNELGMKIYQLNRPMANHDLAFRGFGDYWRRNVRCGLTYAAVASRCFHSTDRLWLRETISNLIWGVVLVLSVIALFLDSWLVSAGVILALLALLGRKHIQFRARGYSNGVAALYAVHTYFAKIPIAAGIGLWLIRGVRGASSGAPK